MEKLRVVTSSEVGFQRTWDDLLAQSKASPVYNSAHLEYYEETSSREVVSDFSCVVLIDGTPIVGCLLMLCESSNSKFSISYLDNPGLFIAKEGVEPNLEAAISALSDHLFLQGLKKVALDKGVELDVVLPGPFLNRPAKLVSLLLEQADSLSPGFQRYVDFEQETASKVLEGITRVKSVRLALRQLEANRLETYVIDSTTGLDVVKESVQALKKLHFNAAKRATRSDHSWALQERSIKRGQSFLILLKQSNLVLGGSLFICGKDACYYGVSATEETSRNLSLGHLMMIAALEYAAKKGYSKVWIGSQYSKPATKDSRKIESIEKFKSYFGDALAFQLLVQRGAQL